MFVRAWLSRRAIVAYLFVAAGVLLPVESRKTGAQELALDPAPVDVVWDEEDGDAEHLVSGLMHEAFASPVVFDPEPGMVVPKEPPAPIDEMPPDFQPDADSIWIEGYWAWDDEREDFVWISGVYRVPPVGRRWVPGYWQEVPGGYQWVAGFWTSLEQQEVTYLPDPPASQEHGPTSPAPSDDHFWASGHWQHHQGRYVWRPGYWAQGHEQWVWVPAQYVWTPHGYVFVAGYWDHRFIDRGICFAPVYWRRPVYLRSGFYYRPFRVIDLARLHLHLFVRPRYSHYYYGNWYGRPARWGIHASFAFHGRYGYDPLWSYNRWHFGRRGIDYSSRVRGWHRYFHHHVDRRPPSTWHGQRQFTQRHRDYKHLGRVVLGHDLRDFAARHQRSLRQTTEPDRRRMHDTARAMREVRDVRRQGERDGQPGRVRLPETPDVRRERDRVARVSPDRRPPDIGRSDRRPDVRQPDRRPDVRRSEGRPDVRRPEARRSTPSPRPETRRSTPTPRPETRGATPSPRPEARGAAPSPRPETRRSTPTPRPETRGATPSPRSEARRPTPSPRPELRGATPSPRPETRRPTPSPRPEARGATPTPRPETRRSTLTPRPETRRSTPTPRPETRRSTPTPRPETRRSTPTPRPETRRPTPTPRPETRRSTPTPRPETRRSTPTPRPETRRSTPTPRPETRPSRGSGGSVQARPSRDARRGSEGRSGGRSGRGR